MGTPEDVATEKHFTPPTLTEMLNKNINFERNPESEGEAEAIDRELTTIKDTFKEWLRTVSLGGVEDYGIADDTRNLLITLVDEP